MMALNFVSLVNVVINKSMAILYMIACLPIGWLKLFNAIPVMLVPVQHLLIHSR